MAHGIGNQTTRGLVLAAVAAGAMAIGSGAAQARGGAIIGAQFGGGHHGRPHSWSGGPRISVGLGFGPYFGGYYSPFYYPYPPYYRSSVIYRDDYDIRPSATGLLASPYVQQALVAPVGESVTWANGGIVGRVTTTRDGWAGEKYCREFVEDITIDGATHETTGTACQSAGSAWRMVANQP